MPASTDLLAPVPAALLPDTLSAPLAAEPPASVPAGFPFVTHLSLEPLVAYWHAREQDHNPGIARMARAVRKEVDATTCCRGDLDHIEQLDNTRELVDMLMLAVFPPAAATTAISGAIPPFQRRSFYYTSRFAEVMMGKERSIKQPLNID